MEDVCMNSDGKIASRIGDRQDKLLIHCHPMAMAPLSPWRVAASRRRLPVWTGSQAGGPCK